MVASAFASQAGVAVTDWELEDCVGEGEQIVIGVAEAEAEETLDFSVPILCFYLHWYRWKNMNV